MYKPRAYKWYGNCMHLLKIENKLKIGCFYKKSQEEFSNMLWVFLVKQSFQSRLVDLR